MILLINTTTHTFYGIKSDSFAEYNEESKEKNLKFKVNDHVWISKYKNIFDKGYAPNWSEEVFVVKRKML